LSDTVVPFGYNPSTADDHDAVTFVSAAGGGTVEPALGAVEFLWIKAGLGGCYACPSGIGVYD